MTLLLSGDDNLSALEVTEANVNHLRRLLAWMECEYLLNEHMQRGVLTGASMAVQAGVATSERASEIVEEMASRTHHCPIYVRQAVKMLGKALRDHEQRHGVIEVKP